MYVYINVDRWTYIIEQYAMNFLNVNSIIYTSWPLQINFTQLNWSSFVILYTFKPATGIAISDRYVYSRFVELDLFFYTWTGKKVWLAYIKITSKSPIFEK